MFKLKKGSKWPKIDIKNGKLTYGQRLELGVILGAQNSSELEMFDKVFECLYNKKPSIKDFVNLVPVYNEILEGILFWIDKEQKMLKYEPTHEEKQAGLLDLCTKIGDIGTLKTLAKTYGKDPDEILNWEYGKVFGILYADLEEAKYTKRYQDIVMKKS